MGTLLILGSKPDPALPPRTSFDHVACANASGYSAAKLGLPDPVYTVMTSLLASGIGSGRQSLQAMAGLKTGQVYYLKRRRRLMHPVKKFLYYVENFHKKSFLKMQPFYLEKTLRALPYDFETFRPLDETYYDGLARQFCQDDPEILSQIENKRPSTGVIALLLGLAEHDYDRYVISGFSFELTHAYGRNPEIDDRGTEASAHADTDIMILRHLGRTLGTVYTTEAVVNEQTGLPLLPEGGPAP
jgi:hypothetical protein